MQQNMVQTLILWLIVCMCYVDGRGPAGLQGATFSVLLMVAWTSVIKGYVSVVLSWDN